jgi:beta-mannosidase
MFLSQENLKITSMRDNLAWRHHGEWWDTLLYRDQPLFGDLPNMHGWIRASQLMQAEAIRYIVQSNRRRQFQNCGSIIWQFNEPYPNASCTSLTEYAAYPKHAYYEVRKAFAQLDVSLRYDSPLAPCDTPMTVGLYAHSDSVSGPAVLHLEALDIAGKLLDAFDFPVTLQENRCVCAGSRTFVLPRQPCQLFFLRLTLLINNEPGASQLYFFTQAEEANAPLSPMLHLPKAQVRITSNGNGFRAENVGGTVCLYLHGEPEDGSTTMLFDSFITLFPGESQLLIPMEKASSWRFTALNDTEIIS